ncbi:hypothetical protein TKK_0018173 [Trichogramma kaykai]
MQTTPGHCVRCLTSVDAGETFCAYCCSAGAAGASSGASVLPRGPQSLPPASSQPLQPLESFSSLSSTTPTLPPLPVNPLPIVPPKSKRLSSSPSASNRSLKRSRSAAAKPAQGGTETITRASSSRAGIRKTQSPAPAKPTETRTNTQHKKGRAPERPPLGTSTAAAAVPARGFPLRVDSATPTSVLPTPATQSAMSRLNVPPASQSTLAIDGQSAVLTPDLAVALFARLDRLDARLDARDDHLLQRIDGRFDQLIPRLEHVEAAQHELATSVRVVRDDHGRQIASLSERLDALSEAGPGHGVLEAASGSSTDPAHRDEYEVRLGGLPPSAEISLQTAERILQALDLARLCPHIVSVREWRVRRLDAPSPAPVHATTRTMVVRFSCAAWRDEVARAYRLFFDKLSYFLPSFDHVIITGDFNINTLKDKNRHSIYLKSLLSAYNLHIINNEPTHHVIFADGSLRETCLDLCIVRDPSLVLEQSKSLVPFVAGHDLITLRYNFERTPPPPATRMVRSWRTVASHTLNNTILHQLNSVHLLPNSICGPSLDPAVSSLTAAILSAADDVAPLRPATFSTRHKPWVDSEVRSLMRARDRAYRRFRHCRRNVDLCQYRVLRAEEHCRMDTNKNTHYASKLDMRHSPTALWRTLRSLGVLSTGYPSPLLHFTADTLAQHYARISTCLRPLSPEIVNTICSSPLPNAHPTFTLQPITPSYVTKLLSSISSKSMGIDRITSPMLMLA